MCPAPRKFERTQPKPGCQRFVGSVHAVGVLILPNGSIDCFVLRGEILDEKGDDLEEAEDDDDRL